MIAEEINFEIVSKAGKKFATKSLSSPQLNLQVEYLFFVGLIVLLCHPERQPKDDNE